MLNIESLVFVLPMTLRGHWKISKAYLLIHAMVLQEHVKVSHRLEHFDAPQNTSASISVSFSFPFEIKVFPKNYNASIWMTVSQFQRLKNKQTETGLQCWCARPPAHRVNCSHIWGKRAGRRRCSVTLSLSMRPSGERGSACLSGQTDRPCFAHSWVLSLQSCSTFRDPTDCSPPVSGRDSPERILEWVAMPFPGDLPDSGIQLKSLTSLLHWQVGSLPLACFTRIYPKPTKLFAPTDSSVFFSKI